MEISIIVPVYNVEKYICKCIDSILNQTFTDFELILIDDGSTDKSGKICDEYKKKDSRIKVIHKKNEGLSSARNIGLDIAQGKYIGFVDSDDYINCEMYSILYKNIIKHDSDIAICAFRKVNKYFNEHVENINNEVKVFNNIEALNNLYGSKSLEFIVAWNKLYKKEIFDETKYPVGKINEDEFVIHKLYYACKKVIYIDCNLYYYFQRENSIMNKKFTIKRFDLFYAFKDRVEFFRKVGYKELQYNAEFSFVERFFLLYFKGKYELNLESKKLNKFKNIFKKDLNNLIKNPKYNWKEKCMWIIFCVNESLYEKIRKRKEC